MFAPMAALKVQLDACITSLSWIALLGPDFQVQDEIVTV